jgi:hypothetical protein
MPSQCSAGPPKGEARLARKKPLMRLGAKDRRGRAAGASSGRGTALREPRTPGLRLETADAMGRITLCSALQERGCTPAQRAQ